MDKFSVGGCQAEKPKDSIQIWVQASLAPVPQKSRKMPSVVRASGTAAILADQLPRP
jgi:hypothetical protein